MPQSTGNSTAHSQTGKHSAITRLLPFLVWMRLITPAKARDDLFAGLTNAVIVLPQGVAYALIAGMPPEYGLYAAIVPAIIAALFGSSWHLISGPTAALSIVVFTTVSPLAEPGSAEFINLVLVLTLMAGLFQLLLAFFRFGTLVNFVSHSVVVGFTTGAAIVIASSQVKNILGVSVESSGSFISTWQGVIAAAGDTNWFAVSVAAVTVVCCILVKKLLPRWPNMLIAMVVSSGYAWWLGAADKGIQLVGEIPGSLPPFLFPQIDAGSLYELAPGAIAIGLLGLVEAVSIARSVATRSRQSIHGNQEFYGQALSNIVGSVFSSYASSGSFTRTGVNYSSGARTPLAAIIAAISLAAIVLLFADLTSYVPIPSMAGLLLIVSWNLIDFHHIGCIFKAGKSEFAVLAVTFCATLVMALEFAIYLGVILSLVFYLKRTSQPTIVEVLPDPNSPSPFFNPAHNDQQPRCPQLRIIRIEGSLFFGAVNFVKDYLENVSEANVLIVANGVNHIDIAGAEMLMNEAQRRREKGQTLYLSNLKVQVNEYLSKGEYRAAIGEEQIFLSKGIAITQIYNRLNRDICDHCKSRIFIECKPTIIASDTVQN
ncbi:SulP family inorganic anion transporter [Amphritea balenae]|uniref:SulP family inorganic anion transporter n=1 Tax=Amphritea balenae TaxID=452629 RepID=A0A3P1SQ23_9GAMM|nr:SulP family inorganic anion transporter [Amphritea balenae]RRC99278.1 SulP family inorganic anion transporter [Amphritea balenae]GGK72439.1 sodium-independent anion transporter [Amphritea balenae]